LNCYALQYQSYVSLSPQEPGLDCVYGDIRGLFDTLIAARAQLVNTCRSIFMPKCNITYT